MRFSTEFEVFGDTIEKLIFEAECLWKEFTQDEEAELPNDTEFSVEPHAAHDYKATIHIRSKVER